MGALVSDPMPTILDTLHGAAAIHKAELPALDTAEPAWQQRWLGAAASGREAYDAFLDHADNWYMMVIWVGLTWAFFQHSATGLRHFVLDMGAGYELKTNRFWANMTVAASIVLTGLTWLTILGVK